MPTSDELGFDYLEEAQSLKYVTINEALLALDTEIGRLRERTWTLMGGKTPAGTGAMAYEFTVPHAEDGSVDIYDLKLLYVRQGITGSSSTQIKIQKMTGGGQFNAPTDMSGTVTIPTAGYEPTTNPLTTFSGGGTVQSGDKLRAYVVAIGTGSGSYMVQVEVKRQS